MSRGVKISTEKACLNGACSLCEDFEKAYCRDPDKRLKYLDLFEYKR